MARFTQVLQRIGETIPTIEQQIPAVTRDPKDDYLLAYAAVGGADYLVTGDADLLILRQIGNVTIGSPIDLVEIALNR